MQLGSIGRLARLLLIAAPPLLIGLLIWAYRLEGTATVTR